MPGALDSGVHVCCGHVVASSTSFRVAGSLNSVRVGVERLDSFRDDNVLILKVAFTQFAGSHGERALIHQLVGYIDASRWIHRCVLMGRCVLRML